MNEERRDCTRCGFTLPLAAFPVSSGGHNALCRACAPLRGIHTRVALIAANRSLQVVGALALIAMGRVPAAKAVLLGLRWPTIRELQGLHDG